MSYTSAWSLIDFYEENEKELRDLIAAGTPFTYEMAVKKEIIYGLIVRKEVDGPLEVSATAHLDDAVELIDTVIWVITDRTAGSGHDWLCKQGASEDQAQALIAYIAEELEVYDEASFDHTVKTGPTMDFDVVLRAIGEAEEVATQRAREYYEGLLESVKVMLTDRGYQLGSHVGTGDESCT